MAVLCHADRRRRGAVGTEVCNPSFFSLQGFLFFLLVEEHLVQVLGVVCSGKGLPGSPSGQTLLEAPLATPSV